MNTVVSALMTPALGGVVALAAALTRAPWRGGTSVQIHWFLFALAIGWFAIATALNGQTGVPAGLSAAAAVLGSSACGWSWLFARVLFRAPESIGTWPLLLVVLLIMTSASLILSSHIGGLSITETAWMRMIANLHSMISSTVLILALFEPFHDWSRKLTVTERRFRALFAGSYLTLLVVSVLWIRNAEPGSLASGWSDTFKLVCAFLALLGADLAYRFRRRHPLSGRRRSFRARTPQAADLALCERIREVLEGEQLYTDPELRVADLADRLDQPEYRVSQCISGVLGCDNFNQLVNGYRIEHAKRLLKDSRCGKQSILAIALDSGFGSIGPFNRAFKRLVGMTPSEFRRPS